MERKHSDEKEIHQLRNRFRDLAEKSFQQGIFTFTGFLGLSEQDIFWQEEGKLSHAGYRLEGGCQAADRVVARFGSPEELGYEVPFPIVCVHIRPLAQKFADDLSHRDFLGALMNLGIERSTIGDIKVGEREAYMPILSVLPGLHRGLHLRELKPGAAHPCKVQPDGRPGGHSAGGAPVRQHPGAVLPGGRGAGEGL